MPTFVYTFHVSIYKHTAIRDQCSWKNGKKLYNERGITYFHETERYVNNVNIYNRSKNGTNLWDDLINSITCYNILPRDVPINNKYTNFMVCSIITVLLIDTFNISTINFYKSYQSYWLSNSECSSLCTLMGLIRINTYQQISNDYCERKKLKNYCS